MEEDLRFRNPRIRLEVASDLGEFDPEAPELYLAIAASEEGDVAIREIASQIPGLVDAVGRIVPEGVRAEACSGEPLVVEIPAAEEGAADMDLPHFSKGSRTPQGVEEEELDIADPPAGRDLFRNPMLRDDVVADCAGGLGGAIEVDAGDVRSDLAHPFDITRVEAVSQEEDMVKGGDRLFSLPRDEFGHRGGEMGHRDPRLPHPGRQRARCADHRRIGDRDLGAEHERREDVPVKGIVGEAGEHREAILLPQSEVFRHPWEEVGERSMEPPHPLRTSGGTRGESDVGKIVGADRQIDRFGRELGEEAPLGKRPQGGEGTSDRTVRDRPFHRFGQVLFPIGGEDREERLGPPLFETIDDPERRIGGIEDHEGPTRFERAHDPPHEGGAAVGPDRHDVSLPDASMPEETRKPVAPGSQFPVAPPAAGIGDRETLRLPACHLRKGDVDRRRLPRWGKDLGGIGKRLTRRAQVVASHLPIGVFGDLGQEDLVLLEETCHPLLIEEIGVVDEFEVDPSFPLEEIEGQIELGTDLGRAHRLHLEAGQIGLARRDVEHVEEDLENRRPGEIPGDAQLLEEFFEGDVLIRQGPERHLPDLFEEIEEGSARRDLRPQREEIEEESDDLLGFAAGAPRRRGPDDDVLLAGKTGEEDLEGRQQEHEEGRPPPGSQRLERFGERRGEILRLRGPRKGLDRWPGAVGGKIERRGRTGKLPLPVTELLLQDLPLHPAPLPIGMVDVLHGQGGEMRAFSPDARSVEERRLPEEDLDRPAVGDDVVHHEEEDVFRRAKPVERHPEEGRFREIEGMRHPAFRIGVEHAIGIGFFGEIDRVEGDFHLGDDPLEGAPPSRAKGSAKRLLPLAEIPQALPEEIDVEGAPDPHQPRNRGLHVARLKLFDEPETLLGKGEGKLSLARDRGDRRKHRGVSGARGDRFGKSGHGATLEKRPEGEVGAERLPQSRKDPCGKERVPPEGKEVVEDPYPFDVEDLLPDLGDPCFDRGSGRNEGLRGALHLDAGQGPLVHLSTRIQRKGFEVDEEAGNHVVGEPLTEESAEFLGIGRGRGGGVEGHEVFFPWMLPPHRHRAVTDRRVRFEVRRDLPQFDPVAPELDLVVPAAEEFEGAVVAPPAEITGAVHPLPAEEGEGDELLGGEVGTVEIPPGQAGAGDADLPRNPNGDGAEALIEDENLHIGDRAPDRDDLPLLDEGDPVDRGPDRRLGRAVEVPEFPVVEEFGGEIGGERLRAAPDPEGGLWPPGSQQHSPAGRGRLHHRDACADDSRLEPLHVDRLLRVCDHDPPAAEERQEDFEGGDVEGERRDRQHRVLAPEAGTALEGGETVHERPMRDLHPLRFPRRAGGVEEINRIVGTKLDLGGGGIDCFEPGIIDPQQRHLPCRGKSVCRGGRDEDEGEACILDHEAQAPLRELGVEGKIGPPRLEDPEKRRGEFGAAFEEDADPCPGTDPQGMEMCCKPVGSAVEFSVGDRFVPEGDRGSLRFGPGVRGDPGMDESLWQLDRRVVPAPEHLPALPLGEDRQFEDRRRGFFHDAGQERLEVFKETLHRPRLEEIGVELDVGVISVRPLGHGEGEVEFGPTALHRHRLEGEPGHLERRKRVLEDEHHLEEGGMAERPAEIERLDEPLEGEILVAIRFERTLPHLPEKIGEGGIAGEIGPKGERIHEEADQSLDLGTVSPRDRGPHHDIGGPAVAVEEDVEGGQERHEEGRPLLAGEFLELPQEGGGKTPKTDRAVEGLHGRTRLVRG